MALVGHGDRVAVRQGHTRLEDVHRTRVGQDVRDLRRREAGVDRHRDRTGEQRPPEAEHPVDPVGQPVRDRSGKASTAARSRCSRFWASPV